MAPDNKGREVQRKHRKGKQEDLQRWVSPSDLQYPFRSESGLIATKKRNRANRKHFSSKIYHFQRPPRHIQIHVCAYLDIESKGCLHTRWTGRSIGISNRPRAKSIDKLANKALERSGKCKWCGSDKVVKNGKNDGQQLYRCKECKHQFFDNGKFPRMRSSKEAVAFALEMYFDGLSLPKIAKNLRKFLKTDVSFQKVWEWIQKYVPSVDSYLSQFQPQLSGIWHVDEVALKFRPQNPPTIADRMKHVRRSGQQYWHWDAIDEGTRFLVDSHVSRIRSKQEAIAFFKGCKANSPRPVAIVTDDLAAYPDATNKVFYSHFKDRRVEHVHTNGFGARMNNQIVERWHGTLKDRTKAMRGLVSPETKILKGFGIQYNYLRTHSTLGMTPAEAAQIHLPFENGWGDLIGWATNWETMRSAHQAISPKNN